MLTFGDIPHHAPVLLAWALLRHTLNPEETGSVVRKIGGTAIQLNVFQYLTRLLRSLASGGNDVRPGLLVLGLRGRREQGGSPVMACGNSHTACRWCGYDGDFVTNLPKAFSLTDTSARRFLCRIFFYPYSTLRTLSYFIILCYTWGIETEGDGICPQEQ